MDCLPLEHTKPKMYWLIFRPCPQGHGYNSRKEKQFINLYILIIETKNTIRSDY